MKCLSHLQVLTTALVLCVTSISAEPSVIESRTAWFQKARWGVFIHYLAKSDNISAEEWVKLITEFDVDGLAKQLEAVDAGYLIITLGQNSGHYLSPNKTYDSYVGIQPSKLSKRDLVTDLHAVLAPKGIKLMVYLPAGAPDRDKTAIDRLEWKWGPYRNREFQLKWENVIREWSTRWGDKVSGWWFDGCYWPNMMYRLPEPPNFTSFAAAARAGNPNSIIAFNRGVITPIISVTPDEDYTAGEFVDVQHATFSKFWRDGAACLMLSYLGKSWSAAPTRYSTEDVAKWSRKLVNEGGVVTWDVPTDSKGIIPQEFVVQLNAINKAVRQ